MSRQSSGGSKGGATYGPNFLNFMQFFGKFVCSRLPLEGWRPSYGKSWIRPCRDIYKDGKYMNDPVADLGFSRWGCANYQIGIILQIFCRLHKNERIWTGGGRVPGTPLRFTNGICDCPCVCHDTTYCRGGVHKGNE